MPLFSYKCVRCDQVVEKFQHNRGEVEITCEECGSKDFERMPTWSNSRTQLCARDMLEQNILPDADRIIKEIQSGNDSAFLDIYGDK